MSSVRSQEVLVGNTIFVSLSEAWGSSPGTVQLRDGTLTARAASLVHAASEYNAHTTLP